MRVAAADKIRRAGVVSRCKDSCHTRQQKVRGGNRGRKDSAEKKGSGLGWGEHRITVRSIIRKTFNAGFGTKESKLIREKGVQISFTTQGRGCRSLGTEAGVLSNCC